MAVKNSNSGRAKDIYNMLLTIIRGIENLTRLILWIKKKLSEEDGGDGEE